MFRKLLKNKKAQNTAEYALLIALVVAAAIAMQTYVQRALQARMRDASVYLTNQTSDLGTTLQYEPYYLSTNYQTDSTRTETEKLGQRTDTASGVKSGIVSRELVSNQSRTGFQGQGYNTDVFEAEDSRIKLDSGGDGDSTSSP